jgi:hypothetical protein
MAVHLKKHHSDIVSSAAAAASTLRSMINRQAKAEQKVHCSAAVTATLDNMVLTYYIDNCLPFNVADSDSFVDLLNYAASGLGHYVPPARTKLTASVDLLYKQMIEALLLDLKSNPVAITTDAATLSNGHSFLAVTGHYITPAFELRDVTLLVQRMEGSHTGEYVRDLLDFTVSAWEAEGRVFAAVTDNGANFVRGVTISTKIANTYRCACHTMQLALKDSVKAQPSLERMTTDAQKLVKTIRRSGLLTEQLDSIQKMDAAADIFLSAEELGSAPTPQQSLRLILHVVTRFNSMCMLFTRLYQLRSSVDRLCLAERERMEGTCITSEQWQEMGELISVLAPVKEVCDTLESSACPSLSLVIPLVGQLLDHLAHVYVGLRTTAVQAVCASVRTAVYERMKAAFDDRAAQIAMMLDPRVRTKKLPSWMDKAQARANLQIEYHTYPTTRTSLIAPGPPVLLQPAGPVVPLEERAESEEVRAVKRQKRVVLPEESVAVEQGATEIDMFLKEGGIGDDGDPLLWWKERAARYPVLSEMARVYLCIPASSAPAERVFSAGTLVLTDKRRRMNDDRVAQLMFMKKNMELYTKIKET